MVNFRLRLSTSSDDRGIDRNQPWMDNKYLSRSWKHSFYKPTTLLFARKGSAIEWFKGADNSLNSATFWHNPPDIRKKYVSLQKDLSHIII